RELDQCQSAQRRVAVPEPEVRSALATQGHSFLAVLLYAGCAAATFMLRRRVIRQEGAVFFPCLVVRWCPSSPFSSLPGC
ncbi:hypothetical protein, partial [Proteus faecis]|uniref:hypothetical protein n=1 Tax=Proteus faecis TaxID=2050967 RepID=UPI003075D10A